jgi:Ni2+-binding GTPase involved in maturation of urease and hydrogenase
MVRSGQLAMPTDTAQPLAGGVGRFVHVVGDAGAGKTGLLVATATHLRQSAALAAGRGPWRGGAQ